MADVDKTSAEQRQKEAIRRMILLLEVCGEDVSDLEAEFFAIFGEKVEKDS